MAASPLGASASNDYVRRESLDWPSQAPQTEHSLERKYSDATLSASVSAETAALLASSSPPSSPLLPRAAVRTTTASAGQIKRELARAQARGATATLATLSSPTAATASSAPSATASMTPERTYQDAPQQRPSRAKSSSERGKVFRERQRQYEQDLVTIVKQLRKDVKHLRNAREQAQSESLKPRPPAGLQPPLLLPRPVTSASLVKLIQDLYAIFRFGLDTPSSTQLHGEDGGIYTTDRAALDKLLAIKYKEDVLWRVLDPHVACGDLVGVAAVIDQWRKHTAACSMFEIEVDHVEAIAGSEQSPVVVARWTLHAQHSRESLSVLFPSALEKRPELTSALVDRRFAFNCATHFQFSEKGQITAYILEVDYVDAFVRAIGSARDVADLMQFSALTKDATLDDVRAPEPARDTGLSEALQRRHSDQHEQPNMYYEYDQDMRSCSERCKHQLSPIGASREHERSASQSRGQSSRASSRSDAPAHRLPFPVLGDVPRPPYHDDYDDRFEM